MHLGRFILALVAIAVFRTSATRASEADVDTSVATGQPALLQSRVFLDARRYEPRTSTSQESRIAGVLGSPPYKSRIARARSILHRTRDLLYNMGFAQLPDWTTWFLHVTLSWVVFMVLSLLVWMNYYPADPDLSGLFADGHPDPVQTFTDNKFDCLKTPEICFYALFCPALRWADNVNMAGFLRLPVALGLYFTCALLNGLTGTFCYFGPITCLVILLYRHKLRAKLGLPSFTAGTCCTDFFYVFCCSWCAIAQEARVVRYAYQQGTLSLTTGKRYWKSELPDRPFPMAVSAPSMASTQRMLAPPPAPAPLAAQRLVAE